MASLGEQHFHQGFSPSEPFPAPSPASSAPWKASRQSDTPRSQHIADYVPLVGKGRSSTDSNSKVRLDRGRSIINCSFWNPAWNAHLLLVAAVGFSVGHHVFYSSLDGKPSDDQPQMMRYGTLLAFLAKAFLALAANTAFRQRAQTTVQNKTVSLPALSALFAAPNDLIAFFSIEAIREAKLAMSLALYTW
jgi:hypothetical protein